MILILLRSAWLIYGMPVPLFGFKWQLLGDWLAQGNTMYANTYDYTGPLSAFVFKWMDTLFGNSRWVHVILSTILIIFQAGILNTIMLRNKAYEENNYVLAFIYIIMMCGVMDYYMLSPQLMSLTFLVISMNNIFRRIDNQATDEMFLTSGIYLGIATFFYLPSAIFLISYLISFLLFSTAVPRRLMLLGIGFGIVYLFIWAFYFWYDADQYFHDSFFLSGFLREKILYLNYQEFFIQIIVIIFCLLISLSVLFTARLSNFQQKIQRVMFIFLLSAICSVLLSPELSGTEVILAIPSAAFFITHFLLLLRRRWTRALLPTLFILGILLYPVVWMEYFAKDEYFVRENSAYKDQRILLIGDHFSVYEGNKIASPFFDEFVSRKRMEGIKYYADATKIYDTIEAANADIVIDDWGYFSKMKEIFPLLNSRYRKEGNIHTKINN